MNHEADRVHAVEPGESPGFLERIIDPANIADPDRIPFAVGHDHFAELSGGTQPAESPQHEFSRPLIDPTAGDFQVLPHQGAPHVLDGEVIRGELVRIDDHVHGTDTATDQGDRADPVHRLQAFLDPPTCQFGDLSKIATSRHGDGQHGHGAGVKLVDDRRLGLIGQVGEDRVDLIADFLRAHVTVLRKLELHRDDGNTFHRRGTEFVDPGDRVDDVFDRLRDRGFHLLDARPGEHRGYCADGEVDIGEEVDAQPEVRDDSHYQGDRDEDPGEYGSADADF